ncbi:MAG: DUF6348 family protein [Micrococcales bacterium]|nr:DUF6348 family protein [Micrococcales bacterium]
MAETLNERFDRGWTVDGEFISAPGTTLAVVVRDYCDAGPKHLGLEFVLNVDNPAETTIFDCVSGLADDPVEATRQAVSMWMTTTGSAVLELLTQHGEHAGHFQSADPEGFPGWHMIGGAVTGYGVGSERRAVVEWLSSEHPWHDLAPVVEPGLDREMLNGIKIYLAGGPGLETAEVRINGQHHAPASAALAAMGWPRPGEGFSAARTYVLLVAREGAF